VHTEAGYVCDPKLCRPSAYCFCFPFPRKDYHSLEALPTKGFQNIDAPSENNKNMSEKYSYYSKTELLTK